ncbi:MAG TPA: rhomboid family intramembrane serine protease [Casimicrobiaceae bacterium]|nr:rhomboid family intramembrane serine protease [Casimicrobiaceae bacterium]
MPPVTTSLIVANVALYLLYTSIGDMMLPLALWPLGASPFPNVGFAPWQPLTYAFLHGSFTHLLFNMFGIYMFGGAMEQVFGSRRYLAYYTVCVLSAAMAQLLVAWLTGGFYPTVGASGGVFGLLLAYGIYFPNNRVMLLFPPIPMPARVFVVVYAVIELVMGVTGVQSGVAHFAHLGGMVGGFLMLRYWRGAGPTWRRRF